MPSGPKKRKAARRKREMRAHPPDSPPHVPGDGPARHQGKEAESSSSSSSSDHPVTDEEAEDGNKRLEDSSASAAMEGADNGKGETEVPVSKEEVLDVEALLPAAEDVRVEYAEAEKEAESGAAQEELPPPPPPPPPPLAVGPTDVAAALPVTEEVVQAAEVQAVGVEALVAPTETPPREAEGKVVLPPPEARAEQPREVTITTEAARVMSLERRATWWNCCGLLGALTSSDR